MPVVIDEGCQDLASVARIAAYADGIVIKLSKCGGIREAVRMTMRRGRWAEGHARLHDRVRARDRPARRWGAGRLGRPRRAPADPVGPFHGLGFADGRVVLSDAPGLGVEPAWVTARDLHRGPVRDSHGKTGHGDPLRRPARSWPWSTPPTPADGGRGGALRAPRRCRSWPPSPSAAALGADRLLIGVAPDGGELSAEWRAALGEAMDAGWTSRRGCTRVLADDPELVAIASHRAPADRPPRRPGRPRHARRPVQPRPVPARGAVGGLGLRDREDDRDAGARSRRARPG